MSRQRDGVGSAAAVGMLVLASCLALGSAQAAVLFQETFDTDTATTAQTLSTYPAFGLSGTGDAIVTGGVLELTGLNTTQRFRTNAGFAGDLRR